MPDERLWSAESMMRQMRDKGLTFRQIAGTLATVTGQPFTEEQIRSRFRRMSPSVGPTTVANAADWLEGLRPLMQRSAEIEREKVEVAQSLPVREPEPAPIPPPKAPEPEPKFERQFGVTISESAPRDARLAELSEAYRALGESE